MSAALERFDVSGKIALVTGASSGLGEHFARTLAEGGAMVIAAARRVDRLERLVSGIETAGGRAHALALDVADPGSVTDGFARIVAEHGAPDIVVNNAGIAQTKPAIELTEDDWRRVMGTNLDGVWRVATHAAQEMVAAGKPGSIVNIASVLGLRQGTNLLAYTTAKAGVN
jgi:NAD(P)-dependent dehydrogenase (short-subunit alcohol dehydrogenase family)